VLLTRFQTVRALDLDVSMSERSFGEGSERLEETQSESNSLGVRELFQGKGVRAAGSYAYVEVRRSARGAG